MQSALEAAPSCPGGPRSASGARSVPTGLSSSRILPAPCPRVVTSILEVYPTGSGNANDRPLQPTRTLFPRTMQRVLGSSTMEHWEKTYTSDVAIYEAFGAAFDPE